MSKKIKYSIAITLFAFGFIVYSFMFGKLFPYSPIHMGFSKHELSNIVVYTQHGTEFKLFKEFDSLVPFVERFHGMKFLKKPAIFIFKDKESYYRRSISKTRCCTYYNGNIVVSPRAVKENQTGKISLEIYLKHELSHSLLHQHAGIVRASQYPPWLLEGIAVYSANQMGTSFYPSKEVTYGYIREGNFMPPRYFKTNEEKTVNLHVKFRMAFIYSEYACIVDYLIKTYGKDKFLLYMNKLITESGHDSIFQEVYNIGFEDCIQNFRNSVMQQKSA